MSLVSFNLGLLKQGYIIRYKNDGSKFGRSIVKRQLAAGYSPEDACYTHVEVSGGEQHSVNISPPKAKFIDILKAHKEREIQILKYDNEDFANGKRYKVAYFSAVLCNKPYDIRGIFAFLFKWIKQDKNAYFCSEGVAWSFQMVFPDIFWGNDIDKMYPASFNLKYKFVEVCKTKIPSS